MNGLTDEELVSIIEAYRRDSLGVDDGELTNERADALDHYHGRPYGDEKDGRSKVVSKDLAETVEWIMPAIMKVLASDDVAEFIPGSMESEDQVKQESKLTNQVIVSDNDGFLVIHDAVKDSLILKNGYFKHYWEESQESIEKELEGVTDLYLTDLISSAPEEVDIKIIEQDETFEGDELNPATYDVKLRFTKPVGQCVVIAVPCEEVRVSKRCRGSLQESPFTEHVTRKTRSDLIELGMEKTFVYSLASISGENESDDIRYSRDSVADETDDYVGVNYDRSMDEIEYCEAYLRVDYDGDGIAELRKVVTVAGRLPDGDEWNEVIDSVPMTGMVPKRVPHRHVGESLDDELSDLQRIKTVLTRQMLDNVYLTNNQTFLINERANVADFLRAVPGGLRRISGEGDVSSAAQPLQTQPILNQILPAIDYIDSVKANRTGIDKNSTQVSPDLLKQTTEGAYLESLNRASQKVEMIIRMLAETGIKELVKQVHGILRRHSGIINRKLGGQDVSVDPKKWPERKNMTVKVGIGNGSEEEKHRKYMMVNQLQESLMQVGAATPVHKILLFQDTIKMMGFDMPEKYSMSVENMVQEMKKPKPQEANPLAEAEKIKGQFSMEIEKLKLQAKAMSEREKLAFEAQLKQLEAEMDQRYEAYKGSQEHIHKMHELQQDMQKHIMSLDSTEAIATMKEEIKAMIEGIKIDMGKPGIGAGVQDGQ